MNSDIYEKILETINSNLQLTREQCYNLLLTDLTNEKKLDSSVITENQITEIKWSELEKEFEKEETNKPNELRKESKISKLLDVVKRLSLDETEQSEILPVRRDSFISIYSNLKRRQMFKTSMWRKLKENSVYFSNKYLEKRQNEMSKVKKYKNMNERLEDNQILIMSKEVKVSPVLMARLIIEGLIKINKLELAETNSDTCDKQKEKISISKLIKETHLLKDGRLAYEIMECCYMDEDYGPTIDSIKNLSGYDNEIRLEAILLSKNISFIKESELREKGYDKTPDFKLELPIYLNKSGITISWIDSKATFGDQLSHNEYYETQFKFYLNRFGSGLVIYWLGYVKSLENCYNSISHRSVVVCDHFPDDFTPLDLESFIENEHF